MKRSILACGAFALLTFALPNTKTADAAVTLGFGYPARFCQTTTPGANVQPNGSSGIGNWSGSPQGVDCPFIADNNDTQLNDVNRVWLYSSINGVSNCLIMTTNFAGNGYWYFPPNRTRVETTFWRLEWDKFVPVQESSAAQSIHCILNNNGRIAKYGVKRIFM